MTSWRVSLQKRLGLLFVLATTLFTVGLLSTSDAENGSKLQKPGIMQWKGYLAKTREEGSTVATSQAEWEGMWRKVGKEAPGELPKNAIAIGVFLGERPTGGYSVTALSIDEVEGRIIVSYEERRPKPLQAVTMGITSPYLIQVFPIDIRKVD